MSARRALILSVAISGPCVLPQQAASQQKPSPAPKPVDPAQVAGMQNAMRDASAAYDAYRKALGAGDLGAIRRLCGPDRADWSGNAEASLARLRAEEPGVVQIVGGTASANQVMFNVVGRDQGPFNAAGRDGGRRWRGVVFMLQQGGAWKVNREMWDPVQ
jgi:hypothetical protein